MAACTSAAAASMLRLGSNSSVRSLVPWKLVELMTAIPGIVENCFSRGVATEEAIDSGPAPGRSAETRMIGVLKLGSAAIGRERDARTPGATTDSGNSTVIAGRRMQSSESVMKHRHL